MVMRWRVTERPKARSAREAGNAAGGAGRTDTGTNARSELHRTVDDGPVSDTP
jgi:hypothetical protein